jgi:hypothetical protein
MFKKFLRSKKGTAEIVGTALFLVILLFFFSNVFLFHDRVSREMDQVVADRVNSPVQLLTASGSGNLTYCAGNPIFYGFGLFQSPPQGEHDYNPPPYQLDRGPPYGMPVSGSYTDTTQQDGVSQVLSETGYLVDAVGHGKLNDDYVCLNATYNFATGFHSITDLRLMGAITFSFYGSSSDMEGEAVDVNLYNFNKGVFEEVGLKILNALGWYNITVQNPAKYISLSSGNIIVNYLSDFNGYYYDEQTYLTLSIDYQAVSVDPTGLRASDLGGRDLRLEQLWITEVNSDNHIPIDLSTVPGTSGTPVEVWIAAGSSIDIVFGTAMSYDNKTLTVPYTPVSGKVNFKVLTNLGNMATTTIDFP